MSDELIRKSDVLDLLDDLGLNLIDYDIYSQLFDTVDNMPPINAVELPCKVGDTVYEPCKYHKKIYAFEAKGFTISEEEAEKALEDLKNDKRKQT